MISITDIRTDMPKIMDFLDNTLLTDSTITMMPDDYIKKAAQDNLSQVVFMQEGFVTLAEDADSLSSAMLRASLNDKDINLILNASLKVSDLQVFIADSSPEEKTDDAKANEMLDKKLESMCSIDNLISIVRDNKGTPRVRAVASEASAMAAKIETATTGKKVEPIMDMLYIERPLVLNLDILDIASLPNDMVFNVLGSLMSVDSNSELGIQIPISAFCSDIQTFFNTDLPAVCDSAVVFAKSSTKNSISFTAEPDPFQSLFNSL